MDKTYLKFEQIGMSFRRGEMATKAPNGPRRLA